MRSSHLYVARLHQFQKPAESPTVRACPQLSKSGNARVVALEGEGVWLTRKLVKGNKPARMLLMETCLRL
jgi:hypothetical protein